MRDIASVFNGLKGESYVTQIDLAILGTRTSSSPSKTDTRQLFVARTVPCEFIRAGSGLGVSPAAFTLIVKRALGKPHPHVVYWLDDVLISSLTWKEHITTIAAVFMKLSNTRLSVNYGKCRFAASS